MTSETTNYNVDRVDLTDISLHGHFSNHNLYEGNVIWQAVVSDFWGKTGPKNTFFRNQVWGKDQGEEGIGVCRESDTQNIIANDLRRNSTITREDDIESIYEEGNRMGEIVYWNELSGESHIPPSLYLADAPEFWPDTLLWPPYRHDQLLSATNKIPAQLRYEAMIADSVLESASSQALQGAASTKPGAMLNKSSVIPEVTELNPSYPNPFGATTTLSYALHETMPVLLRVFDVTGREVATLVDELQSAGRYQMSFEGATLPAGVYYYRFAAGSCQRLGSMVKVK